MSATQLPVEAILHTSGPFRLVRHKPRIVDSVLVAEAAAALDPLIVFVTAILGKFLYLDLFLTSAQPTHPFIGIAFIASVMTYAVFRKAGMHELTSFSGNYWRIAPLLALTFGIVICLLFVLDVPQTNLRGWFIFWFAASFVLLLAYRATVGLYIRVLVAERRLVQRVAVVGSGELAARVVTALMRDPNIVLMGVYEEFPERPSIGIEDLIACARADQCDRVVIALPLSAKERLEVLLSKLAMLPVEVQLCPDASTLPCPMFGCSPVGNLLGLDVQRAPLNARGVLVKALMDYVIASIALVAFSPLMLLIAIAIKVDTRGPVFFVQSRHGYNQRIIRFIKFRTMRVLEDGHTVVQAYRHDARVTRVGRFLRRSSLDELPQLINVIRGELSLVGPRAHPLTLNDTYGTLIENYGTRHKIKPGITGWAQVMGFRGETRDPELMRERIRHDLWYIDNWSPLLDLRILLKTLKVPFDPHVY